MVLTVFVCNKCFVMMTAGAPNEVSFMTSCFHIFCNKCLQEMQNNICPVCNKPCQVTDFKDLTVVKPYFEPPLQQATIAEKIRVEAIAKAKAEEDEHLKEQHNKKIAEEQATPTH